EIQQPQPEPPPSSIAEVVEDATVSADPVADIAAAPEAPVAETLAPTEPSPESALPLDIAGETTVAGAGLADDVSMTTSEQAPQPQPSDPAFDAMIEEFV